MITETDIIELFENSKIELAEYAKTKNMHMQYAAFGFGMALAAVLDYDIVTTFDDLTNIIEKAAPTSTSNNTMN